VDQREIDPMLCAEGAQKAESKESLSYLWGPFRSGRRKSSPGGNSKPFRACRSPEERDGRRKIREVKDSKGLTRDGLTPSIQSRSLGNSPGGECGFVEEDHGGTQCHLESPPCGNETFSLIVERGTAGVVNSLNPKCCSGWRP